MVWDIFCTVIDNYGDIGVTWRLARQLATEHNISVRLWVDDLEAFRHIHPEVDPALVIQHLGACRTWGVDSEKRPRRGQFLTISPGNSRTIAQESGKKWTGGGASQPTIPKSDRLLATRPGSTGTPRVEVRHWTTPLPPVAPGDVVIEALACNLPEDFLARMAAQDKPPLWLNLEYLTAEDWAEGVHTLPSPHPRLPLTKYFFMPGFSGATGGLTREAGLSAARTAFQRDAAARQAFWAALGLPAPAVGELRFSLFSYDNRALSDLLDACAAHSAPVSLCVPQGQSLTSVADWHGGDLPQPGDVIQQGNLHVHVLPMLDQDTYDQLLWACDFNLVRGEDSFLRAQYAARPLLWQAYRQEEAAHFLKVDAFLKRYCADMPHELANWVMRCFHAWNHETHDPEAWRWLLGNAPAWQQHARSWYSSLEANTDLAANLLIFCEKKLQ